MMDKATFYKSVRASLLGPTLSDSEVQGCEAILTAMLGTTTSHCAYALATAYHETARTMQPVIEAYWLSENWRKRNLRYWPWYGRGFVQLTWQGNYEKADQEAAAAGLIQAGELIANPALACRLDIAAFIMRQGMEEGWFTNGVHTLGDHLPDRLGTITEFEQCRRIINGMDKAHSVALYAEQFQTALSMGGW